jgi:hypothetical protein
MWLAQWETMMKGVSELTQLQDSGCQRILPLPLSLTDVTTAMAA